MSTQPATASGTLFDALFDDAAMFPPGNASAVEAVTLHGDYRMGPHAGRIGPLVVADDALGKVERATASAGIGPLDVSVVASAGAGSLTGLADRMITHPLDELTVVSAEIALRDLDNLPGATRRVVAATGELPPEITVYVELPDAAGWQEAAEQVEAAGLLGKLRTGGAVPQAFPSPERLAKRLSVLVELDLSFKLTAGLHHALPTVVRTSEGRLPQHGLVAVIAALHALIEGESVATAAELLRADDPDAVVAVVRDLDEPAAAALRRRLRSVGCCGVLDPLRELGRLHLL